MSIDIFCARQPIFDRQQRVIGYELLYRSGPDNAFGPAGPQADVASAENLDRTLLGFGLDRLTAGRKVFVNASRRILMNELYTLLPKDRAVIELIETVEPDSEVIAACKRLKDHGYTLALDDFTWTPAHAPLVDMADLLKIDFLQHDRDSRRRMSERWATPNRQLLAEKVEHDADWREGLDAGYQLFQGFFFARPQMVQGKDIAANKVNFLRLLKELHTEEMNFERVEAIISQEVALSVKLLRYLNSAGFGWHHEVTSIRQGVRLLGSGPLRKWASLVAVIGLSSGKPQELVVTALTRARFAERLARVLSLAHYELDLFLAGLLSTIDALTDRPLVEALAPLAVSPQIRTALLEGAAPLGDALRIVIGYERGRWDVVERVCHSLGIGDDAVGDAYSEAVLWAEDHAQP